MRVPMHTRLLPRWRYPWERLRSRAFSLDVRSLLDESIDADIEAICLEIEALKEKPASPAKEKPRRAALPASFPRREIRHEPQNTECRCGCRLVRIGEDVSEKLTQVLCPRCLAIPLSVTDQPLGATHKERHMRCPTCNAYNSIRVSVRSAPC
jgi:hypothetical protein